MNTGCGAERCFPGRGLARAFLPLALAALLAGCAAKGQGSPHDPARSPHDTARSPHDPAPGAPASEGGAPEVPAAAGEKEARGSPSDPAPGSPGDPAPGSPSDPAPGSRSDPAPGSPGDPAPADELRRLRARAAELEATLHGLQMAPGDPTPAADVKALLAMVGRGDGPTLEREVEKLLLGGEAGFKALHDFFHQADVVEHDKIDAITHHPILIYAMLRLVALHPDEVARFSSFLMKATRDRPDSWLRREYFNFLPVFILHHEGRYPELRRDLEDDIVYQIEQGGASLYKVALAMRDLDFQPPVEIYLPILADPEKHSSHGQVIQLLEARKEEGLRVLKEYVSTTTDLKLPTAGEALRAIARIEGPEGETVRKLLSAENPDLRGAALFAYFNEPRDDADLPLAVDVLNWKEPTLAQKRRFLSLIAQKSPRLFDAIFAGAETSVQDQQVKEAIRRTAAALEKRRAKKGTEKEQAPGVSQP